MKLLAITAYYKPAYVYGGPVQSISALCAGLVNAGAQVTVYTTNANGPGRLLDVPTDRPVDVDGVEVHYFPLAWPSRLIPFYAPALGQACRAKMGQFDAAYFYATWTYPMLAGARVAVRAKLSYVVSPRGAFMTRSLQEKRLKKWLYFSLIERNLVNRAAAIHCTSTMEQQELNQLKLRPSSTVIPNGLDLAPFAQLPIRGKLRESLGLSSCSRLSVFVGRLAPEKQLTLTIEAFARVAQQLPGAHLAIIGPDGGSEDAARQQVQTLQLGDRVHFPGLLTGTDLLQAYADADLLVLLSRRENFGMVVVEAMAAGVPVLLSDTVGLAEEIDQAGAGRVVTSQVEEVAEVWQQMINAPDAQEMGARGRMWARQHFSWDVVTAHMLNLLSCVSEGIPYQINHS